VVRQYDEVFEFSFVNSYQLRVCRIVLARTFATASLSGNMWVEMAHVNLNISTSHLLDIMALCLWHNIPVGADAWVNMLAACQI
jgi:hypothetical protein